MRLKSILSVFTLFVLTFSTACEKNKDEPATPPQDDNKAVTEAINRGLDLITVQGGTFAPYPANYATLTTSLSTYKIGKFEVTREFWYAVINEELYQGDCPTCPIDNIDLQKLPEFFSKLNTRTGKKYRLPTETEWIFASIGGNQSMGFTYSGSNDPEEVAWHADMFGQIKPVGQKKPNELGIYDMHGNVSEMCSDYFIGNEYAVETHQPLNPTGPITGFNKVLRGGNISLSAVRMKERFMYTPNTSSYSNSGFRIVEQQIPDPVLKLGQTHQGGVIVFLDQTNQHGLILADATQERSGYEAFCAQMTILPVSTSGLANTQLIANNCPNTAAGYCYNLNYNGFSDWFLPSISELRSIYYNTGINFGLDLLMSSFSQAGNIQGFSWNSSQMVTIYYPSSALFRPVRSF